MAMKKVYSKKTGKVTWAQPNPARPGQYLMPADATEFPPPAFDDSTKKAKYVNNSWVTEDLTPEEIHEASGSTGTFIGQLDDIGNITLDSVTDGQALVWDADNNKWTNGNVAAGESVVSSGGGGGGGGGGIIRQVKNYKMMGKVATEDLSTGWVDVQTISFTPKSATSKILISVVYGMSGKGSLCLLRDGTAITAKTANASRAYMNWQDVVQQNSDFYSERYTMSMTVEDSPNTTNTITYKTQILPYSPTVDAEGGICVNPIPYNEGNGVYSSVTIWEVDESNDLQNLIDSQTNVDGPCFHAILGGSTADTRNQTPLLFNVIKTNHTNSYNPATGLFTAPEDGYYYFGAGAHRSSPHGWTTIRLYIGGEIISNAWGNDDDGNNGQLFCSGVKYMYTGDTAYVSMDTGKSTNYMSETYWYFNGYKIANGNSTVNITSGSNEIDGITSSDGRIGIGIENPHHNLHLAGDSSQYGSALKIEENTHATSARAGIHMGDWVIGQDAPGDGTKDFFFYSAGHRLFIKQDGKIGIGTTTPKSKLDIIAESTLGKTFTGNIRGEGITISKSYVENDYISLLESSNNIDNIPHVRIAAKYNGGGSYLSFGTSLSYASGITNEALLINPHGECYINNLLYVKTASGQAQIGSHNDGWFHFFTDRGAYYFNKNCQAAGGFTTYSDERLKENVTVVENAVESLKKIRGVSFTWKKDADSQKRREGKMFGVLAQEVLQIDPEMCELPEAVSEGDEKFYTFDYSNLTPFFIEAIKEQQATIESQQAKIDSLEARLAALEAKLS